jgi:hypothetical protein
MLDLDLYCFQVFQRGDQIVNLASPRLPVPFQLPQARPLRHLRSTEGVSLAPQFTRYTVNCISCNIVSHLLTHPVVYIIALCSSLNTTTFCLFSSCLLCPDPNNYEPGIPAPRCDTQIRLFTLLIAINIVHVVPCNPRVAARLLSSHHATL